MKQYAATSEYGDILVTTIRDTIEDCIAAAIKATSDFTPCTTETELYAAGVCIAEFDDPSVIMSNPLTVSQGNFATRTYVRGGRTGEIVPPPGSGWKHGGDSNNEGVSK